MARIAFARTGIRRTIETTHERIRCSNQPLTARLATSRKRPFAWGRLALLGVSLLRARSFPVPWAKVKT